MPSVTKCRIGIEGSVTEGSRFVGWVTPVGFRRVNNCRAANLPLESSGVSHQIFHIRSLSRIKYDSLCHFCLKSSLLDYSYELSIMQLHVQQPLDAKVLPDSPQVSTHKLS